MHPTGGVGAHEHEAVRRLELRVHHEVLLRRIVGHAGENGGMLFFINRLGAQTGNVRFVDPDVFGFTGKLEIAFTFLGSGARVVDKRTLRVELAAEDVLVLRLT